MKIRIILLSFITILSYLAVSVAIAVEGDILWKHVVGGNLESTPAVDDDGNVYVVTYTGVRSYSPDGIHRWSTTVRAEIGDFNAPSLSQDNSILYGGSDDGVWAIDAATGSLIWENDDYDFPAGFHSVPAVSSDGLRIYMGCGAERDEANAFYAINTADGSIAWEYRLTYPPRGFSGFIGGAIFDPNDSRIIYLTSQHGYLVSLTDNGDSYIENWVVNIGAEMRMPPAIDANGYIYVGDSRTGRVHKFDPRTSTMQGGKWPVHVGANEVFTSIAIGTDGTIYVNSEDKRLWAINPDGTVKWNNLIFEAWGSDPLIRDDGKIIVAIQLNGAARVAAIRDDGNQAVIEWTSDRIAKTLRLNETNVNLAPDGTIYITSGDQEPEALFAIEGNGRGLSTTSAWPKYMGNIQNNGHAANPEIHSVSPDHVRPPEMEWQRGYGTSYGNHVHEGFQTRDGGYVAIGQTWEAGNDYTEMLVVKTDANGNKQWQTIIGTGNQHDIGICIAEVSDGLIAGGGLHSSESQQRGLVKLDFDGGVVWQKTYPADGHGAIRGVDITSDGEIITTGYTNAPEQGFLFICDEGEGFIMKTDADGNLQWDKTISAPQGTKIREINGGYAICSTKWIPSENNNVVLILTDHQGNETYTNNYGSSGNDQCFDFDLTSDGGYILAGHTTSYGVNWDYYLLKVDGNGKKQWHKTFGQPRGYDANYIHDESYGVRHTPDGGYIIAGGSGDEYRYSESGHPAGSSDEWKAYLVKTDGDGNMVWGGVYPPYDDSGNNAAEYVGLTSDGGYIVFTDSDGFYSNLGSNAFGFMKIGPDESNINP
ncbi:PQQ-binding-like beta-propeller repeat protein [Candidatus Poribacteria bacterium]